MLDAFIIEQLKKREEELEQDDARPVLRLPLPEPLEYEYSEEEESSPVIELEI